MLKPQDSMGFEMQTFFNVVETYHEDHIIVNDAPTQVLYYRVQVLKDIIRLKW